MRIQVFVQQLNVVVPEKRFNCLQLRLGKYNGSHMMICLPSRSIVSVMQCQKSGCKQQKV